MLDVHLERTSASLANEDLGGKKKKKDKTYRQLHLV